MESLQALRSAAKKSSSAAAPAPASSAAPASTAAPATATASTSAEHQWATKEDITTMMRLLSVHNRDLNTLKDRVSLCILLYDEEYKKDLQEVRNAWRAADPTRIAKKEAKEVAAAAPAPAPAPAAEGSPPPPAAAAEDAAEMVLDTEAEAPQQYQPHPQGSQRSLVWT